MHVKKREFTFIYNTHTLSFSLSLEQEHLKLARLHNKHSKSLKNEIFLFFRTIKSSWLNQTNTHTQSGVHLVWLQPNCFSSEEIKKEKK